MANVLNHEISKHNQDFSVSLHIFKEIFMNLNCNFELLPNNIYTFQFIPVFANCKVLSKRKNEKQVSKA
jgi:hypothetical protein